VHYTAVSSQKQCDLHDDVGLLVVVGGPFVLAAENNKYYLLYKIVQK